MLEMHKTAHQQDVSEKVDQLQRGGEDRGWRKPEKPGTMGGGGLWKHPIWPEGEGNPCKNLKKKK